MSVPKSYAFISSTTTTGEQTMLMRRPSNCFNRSNMLAKFCLWCLTIMDTPKEKLIVISTRCKLLFIKAPLETAYLLLMTYQFFFKIILCSKISMQNCFVSGASTQESRVPSNTTNSSIMSVQAFDHLAFR